MDHRASPEKPVFPCLLDQTSLPPSLAGVQAIPGANAPEAADKIVAALDAKTSHESPPNTQQVLAQLATIRVSNESDALRQFRATLPQGSIYQAGRDIYIGTSHRQTWVAIIAIILIGIGVGLWRNPPIPSAPGKNALLEQPFAGSIWRPGNEPLAGVNVSLLFDGKLVGTTTTDSLGRFRFRVKAAPDSDITLIAQKQGFQTDKRYAQLGNTNFNFTMARVSQ